MNGSVPFLSTIFLVYLASKLAVHHTRQLTFANHTIAEKQNAEEETTNHIIFLNGHMATLDLFKLLKEKSTFHFECD